MDKISKYINFVLIALIIAISIFGYIRYTRYETDLTKLRNALAQADKTIETVKGTFTRLTMEISGLKATNTELQKTIEKQKLDVITAEQLAITWRKKYNVYVKTHPDTDVHPPDWWSPIGPIACTPQQNPLTAEQDFGLVKSTVYLMTADPQTQVRLALGPGGRPLKLNLALTRDKDKTWRSFVTVEPPDDENISVDIVSTAVNMEPLDERWYEKLKLHMDFGVGSGVLGGAGLSYELGNIDFGPSIWGATSGNGGSVFYGLNFSWAPFKKK